jgi:murein tripeptide amidase MpaA
MSCPEIDVVIQVVPMLNPDGVAFGNYRCNLGGYDLNRVWQQPDPLLHPTIHATKALLKQLHAARGVGL